MGKFRYIIFLLIQFISSIAFTQNQQIRFERIGTKEGLSDPNVTCIMQDSRGFMWIGTNKGLNRYDGHQFKVFHHDPSDPESISSNYIQRIIEDRKGNIWIATSGGGINKYDRKMNRFKQYVHEPDNPNSLSGNTIRNIVEDQTGKFWIASNDGLNLLDPETNHFIHFFHDKTDSSSLSGNQVTDVLTDSKGDLWVGTLNGGLNLFSETDSTFIRFQADSKNDGSISGNSIFTIFEDSRQRIWIGTTGEGLNLFDRKTGKFRSFKQTSEANSLSNNNILSINEDNNGYLLVGTENGGINSLDSSLQEIKVYINDEIDKNSLSANSVHCITKDNRGNIWVGVFAGGINVYKRSTSSFNHYKHNSSAGSISNNFVLSLYEDRSENLWIGTDGGGLNRIDHLTGKLDVYTHNPNRNSIAGNYILALTEDDKGNLWIGTWGNGMSQLNLQTGKFRNFKYTEKTNSGLSSNNIYAIKVIKNGKIWIGTFSAGIDIYDPQSNSFSHFRKNREDKNSLSDNKIYCITEDRSGKIWIGTADGGISLFESQTNSFIRFNEMNKKLGSNTVYDILETSTGTIFACTATGLHSLDPSSQGFLPIKLHEKSTSEYAFAALEDEKGNLWISTNSGISKYNPETRKVTNYSVDDGLQDGEFKPHSAFKTKSGRLLFGGINGYNSFMPDQIQEYTYDPPIVLTDFLIFNKSVPVSREEKDALTPLKQEISETKSIRLSYKQSVITFEFASLDFSSSDKKTYAYQMEGFDTDWNIIQGKNSATYTNLNHGDYTFKVKSQNKSGEWSSQIRTLEITIVPPFWLTWWFKILVSLVILAMPFGFTYLRIKRLRHQRRILENLVAERTREIQIKNELLKDLNSTKDKLFSIISHDLRSPFSAILGFQDILVNNYFDYSDEVRLNMLRQVYSTTNQVYSLVENLLNWAKVQDRNIQHHPVPFNLRSAILEKLDLYRNIAEAKRITLDHDLPDDLIAFADVHLMETTLRNLINNAVKFTSAGGRIWVKAIAGEENITIFVTDSGTGMTKEQIGTLFKLETTRTQYGTNGEKGSGLGLMLCKEFVEKNKGNISVESQPGKGSTFSFTLPAFHQT